MARSHKFVGEPSPDAGVNVAAVSKQEFGRRIQQELLKRGWKQSDLARAAFGTTTSAAGYTVAKNRELVSQFVGGKSFPSPLSLHKIAQALGKKPEDLMPQIRTKAIEDESDPDLEFKVAAGKGDEGLLRINRIVTIDQFARIMAILQEGREPVAAKRR